MAGARETIVVEIQDAELQAEFKRLIARLADLQPFFNDVGEQLLNSTRERFRSQTAPDGTRWAPLSPGYRERKKRNKNQILTLYGHLRGTLVKQTDAHGLRIGTPLIYGATHQFGRPEANIPARPFLGLSAADRSDLLDALQDWLARP